jgi:hypothetical protein
MVHLIRDERKKLVIGLEMMREWGWSYGRRNLVTAENSSAGLIIFSWPNPKP